jgi:hypothetical protein
LLRTALMKINRLKQALIKFRQKERRLYPSIETNA